MITRFSNVCLAAYLSSAEVSFAANHIPDHPPGSTSSTAEAPASHRKSYDSISPCLIDQINLNSSMPGYRCSRVKLLVVAVEAVNIAFSLSTDSPELKPDRATVDPFAQSSQAFDTNVLH